MKTLIILGLLAAVAGLNVQAQVIDTMRTPPTSYTTNQGRQNPPANQSTNRRTNSMQTDSSTSNSKMDTSQPTQGTPRRTTRPRSTTQIRP